MHNTHTNTYICSIIKKMFMIRGVKEFTITNGNKSLPKKIYPYGYINILLFPEIRKNYLHFHENYFILERVSTSSLCKNSRSPNRLVDNSIKLSVNVLNAFIYFNNVYSNSKKKLFFSSILIQKL